MHAESAAREQSRSALAKMVTKAFENWHLSSVEQTAMLGLAPGNRAAIHRYRKGAPLAASRDMLERAGHILAIHKSLRILFPHNRDLAYQWMRTRNRAFDNRTPAELIQQRGFEGLLMVRAYLDRARAH
ncbi:hypothetical protein J2T57_001625 [Natronocella acetinitrilica]|uniref:DUF2384 domain-containing protein n=1 Tax=Natronocella acetinitrilica TaxID=414046 RepID=A0AAE3KC49_9GAMM|nr:MbcA/ParS/Xre antitoxin family protein [Natronocella acetinitrilica]MCP1674523.1 hypothetical protein [Natronocella acetinitrilica]